MTKTLDGRAALAAMKARRTNPSGKCLLVVDQAFGTPGNADGHAYPIALNVWQYAPAAHRHAGDYNAPAGALLIFGASPNRHDSLAGAGDIGIANGGGVGAFTDGGGAGRIGLMTIAARAKQISRPYLGWVDSYCGFIVGNLGPVSVGAVPASAVGKLMKISQPGVTVRMVQQRLIAHGFSVGPTGADNKNGINTTAGLGAFQHAEGLVEDLNVGTKTWAKLSAAPAPMPAQPAVGHPLLKRGSRGEAVKVWQRYLKTHFPLYAGKLVVDGKFEGDTEAKTKDWQGRSNLKPDGEVGPLSWGKSGL